MDLLDCLLHRAASVAGESIVEVSDEEVFVVIIQSHECASHDNVLHLVHRVTQLLQLVQWEHQQMETKETEEQDLLFIVTHYYMHTCMYIIPGLITGPSCAFQCSEKLCSTCT